MNRLQNPNVAAAVEGPQAVSPGLEANRLSGPGSFIDSFYRQRPVGAASAPLRGVVWGVIFSAPFWLLAGIVFIHFVSK